MPLEYDQHQSICIKSLTQSRNWFQIAIHDTNKTWKCIMYLKAAQQGITTILFQNCSDNRKKLHNVLCQTFQH